jgi:hypothetical protein
MYFACWSCELTDVPFRRCETEGCEGAPVAADGGNSADAGVVEGFGRRSDSSKGELMKILR